jgi:F-type H+-transporting ATPase subunit alpha
MNNKKITPQKQKAAGKIVRIQDNIITVFGLGNCFLGEIIIFNNDDNFDIYATVAVIEDRNSVKLILVKGNQVELSEGVLAFRTCKVLQTLVGFGMLGKIITSLGDLVDDDEEADPKTVVLNDFFNIEFYNIFARSPSIIQRETVAIPFFTGVSTIDCFTPIGCGQRQLIIGDFNTGKTSLALTMLLNQRYIMNFIDKV